ncbi:MAG: tRNA epoxyqueuosine(34) reductase QueG [Gammaproteobacteria bacterium]|nr:tRNA epoxyqueuosine(34) reductase QueG [Gammaproteobacteria bacterium]
MSKFQNQPSSYDNEQLIKLARQIKVWGRELGFQQIAITDTSLEQAEKTLASWLKQGCHGDMEWMASHGLKRTRPAELVTGTHRIITGRMDYWPPDILRAEAVLATPEKAYISRYALGRDYHKVLRKRLQKLSNKIEDTIGKFGYRVFVDSAPVMEKPLAEKAGLGWIGKHSNVLNKDAGSWFFLGEIYTDLPLPVDQPTEEHCGTCQACIDLCPTKAITKPYVVDARLCISYLTIELKGAIPEKLRPMMGNRIYGCDDCQLCCPWNRFATDTSENDFMPRHHLDDVSLLDLFNWDEATFLTKTEGTAIRRIGHERWLRNIAVALGNAESSEKIILALESRLKGCSENDCSGLVKEHIEWALQQHKS